MNAHFDQSPRHDVTRPFTIALLFAALFSALSGCDTAPGEARPDQDTSASRDSIVLLRPLPDTSLYDGQRLALLLLDYFQHSGGGQLSFEVTSPSAVIDINLIGSGLHVKGRSLGTAPVELTASAPDVDSVTTRFDVVTLPCPTVVGEDEASYFPHDVGERWTYDYARTVSETTPTTRIEGELTWKVLEITDECTERRVSLQERFEGRKSVVDYDTSWAVSWTKMRTARLDGELLVLEPYIEASDSVRWIHPRTADERVVVQEEGFDPYTQSSDTLHYTIRRGVGIAEWYDAWHGRYEWRDRTGLSLKD